MEEDEIGRTCCMHCSDEKCIQDFSQGKNLKVRTRHRTIILKCICRNQARLWSGFP
jgi:hypothetical protein